MHKLRNKKQFLAFILLIFLLMTISGCFNSKKQENIVAEKEQVSNIPPEKMLRIAVFQGGYGREIWNEIAGDFEKENPGIHVEITANPDIATVIRPQILKGNPPDFIYCPSTNRSGLLQSMIADKQLMDLNDVFTDQLRNRLLPGGMDSPTYKPYHDGKIYAAPLFYSVMGMWYDKHLFEENGWSSPKTWDEAFKIAKKAKLKDISMYTYAAANAPAYNESVIWPLIATIGGPQKLQNIFSYKKGAWKDASVKKALEVFEKMANEKYLLPGTLGFNHTQSQQLFLQDKVLFIPNGGWFEREMKNSPRASGFTFGFAGLPALLPDSRRYIWTASEEMYIPQKARNPRLAKKFISFLYTEKSIRKMAAVTGGIPPIKDGADLVKDSIDEATYAAYKAAESGVYTTVSGAFAPTEQTNIKIRMSFFKGINELFAGKTTTDSLVNKMETESQKLAKIKINKS